MSESNGKYDNSWDKVKEGADELIELVSELIAARYKKSQIKKSVEKLIGGPISPPNLEHLLGAARARLRELAALELNDQRARAIKFYETIISDDSVHINSRLRAQEALNKLLGIDMKYQDSGGHYLEKARRLRDALEAMDQSVPDEDESNEEQSRIS